MFGIDHDRLVVNTDKLFAYIRTAPKTKGGPKFALVLVVDGHRIMGQGGAGPRTPCSRIVFEYTTVDDHALSADGQFECKNVSMRMRGQAIRPNPACIIGQIEIVTAQDVVARQGKRGASAWPRPVAQQLFVSVEQVVTRRSHRQAAIVEQRHSAIGMGQVSDGLCHESKLG